MQLDVQTIIAVLASSQYQFTKLTTLTYMYIALEHAMQHCYHMYGFSRCIAKRRG